MLTDGLGVEHVLGLLVGEHGALGVEDHIQDLGVLCADCCLCCHCFYSVVMWCWVVVGLGGRAGPWLMSMDVLGLVVVGDDWLKE